MGRAMAERDARERGGDDDALAHAASPKIVDQIVTAGAETASDADLITMQCPNVDGGTWPRRGGRGR